MKYKIIDALYKLFKTRVANYLHKNNLKPDNIIKKDVVRTNNHLCFRIIFSNRKYHDFRFFPYKLTKTGALTLSGSITLATLGTVALAHYGNYKFHENDNGLVIEEVSETEINKGETKYIGETEGDTTASSYEMPTESSLYETSEVSYEYTDNSEDEISNEYVEETTYEESETSPTINTNNRFYREICISGSYDPCATSYEHIINSYYASIKKYGEMYGVDPSLIAALIMEEVGDDDKEYYQTSYSCLGLGQVNCNYFDGETFHPYNYELGEYEDYVFRYNNLANDRDEQIKVIAIFLQRYLIEFDGNVYFALIAYNQGVTTAERLAGYITNCLDYDSKSDTYRISDIGSLPDYNYFTHGDTQYFNKVTTFLKFILENKVFNDSGEVYIQIPGSDTLIVYGVNLTEVYALKGNR